MRIPDGYTRRVVGPSKVKSRGAAAVVAAVSGVAPASIDRVEFSPRAGEVSHARLLALQAPEVRAPLVEEVSSLIAEGQYQVTGAQVAPAMIRDHSMDGRLSQSL